VVNLIVRTDFDMTPLAFQAPSPRLFVASPEHFPDSHSQAPGSTSGCVVIV
jgi:hypothetical protein